VGYACRPYQNQERIFMTDAKTIKVICYKDVQIGDDLYVRGEKYTVASARVAKYITYFTNPKG